MESERRSPTVFAITGTVAFNLDLHVWGVAAEACPQILDRLGCMSQAGFLCAGPWNQAGMITPALGNR